MTVAGQRQVTYSYDNSNRLTQIAQGTSTVGFSYDTANRRLALTLINGVNMSHSYHNNHLYLCVRDFLRENQFIDTAELRREVAADMKRLLPGLLILEEQN
ncbi:MAG TPA: hypothetical protein VGH51_06875 [Candidatus Angelobacter sp.]|jgi:YD repeat-containing protein